MNRKDLIEAIKAMGTAGHLPFGGEPGGIRLQQVPEELADMVLFLRESIPHAYTMLEIGSASGGLIKVLHTYTSLKEVILVDNNSMIGECACRAKVLEGINRVEIIGDSAHTSVQLAVRKLCPMIDFLFIDANHDEPYPEQDFVHYARYVRVGGFVGFHDSAGCMGVAKCCDAVSLSPNWVKAFEVVKTSRQFGITIFERVR